MLNDVITNQLKAAGDWRILINVLICHAPSKVQKASLLELEALRCPAKYTRQ